MKLLFLVAHGFSDIRPIPIIGAFKVKVFSPLQTPLTCLKGGCCAVWGAASCCYLKAGFTSSLLAEIPTTSLPPRMAGDIVSAQKRFSEAVNLCK